MKTDFTARADYLRWLVFGCPAGIFLLANVGLPHLALRAAIWSYIIPAALWGLLAWAILKLPLYRPLSKMRLKSAIIQSALLIGFCQVMVYGIGGLFTGFGRSPYSLTPTGILTNLVYLSSMIAGMELSRAWLVNRFGRKHSFSAVAGISAYYTLLSISLAQITGLKADVQSINIIGSQWVPLLTESLLASMLALHAGPKPAILYRGLLAAFWWFCPILPDLSWGLKAMIGLVVPIGGMVIVSQIHAAEANRGKSRKRANDNSFPLGWVMTATACLAFAWFAAGLFPLKPSLIPTGSMEPLINPGDVVLVAKIPGGAVSMGDIIEYRTEKMSIVHRVIKIEENGNFITKGDNNNISDADPVDPRNVTGRVVLTIPKVGFISIAVKHLFGG